MGGRHSRSGYTLVEAMIVVTVIVVVAAEFAVNSVSCVRLFQATMAQCELPVRMRELRDKLLFRMRMPTESCVYGGLLSMENVHVDTAALNAQEEPVPRSLALRRDASQAHRLLLQDVLDGKSVHFLVDDHAPHDAAHTRWLRPGGLDLADDMDMNAMLESNLKDGRIYLRVKLSAGSKAGMDLGSRTERMIVPLFNMEQQNTGSLQ